MLQYISYFTCAENTFQHQLIVILTDPGVYGVVSYCCGCLIQQQTCFMLDFPYPSFSVNTTIKMSSWNNKRDLSLILAFSMLFSVTLLFIHCLQKKDIPGFITNNQLTGIIRIYLKYLLSSISIILTNSVPFSHRFGF